MEFWLDIAAFALKALLIVVALGALVALAALAARAARRDGGGREEIEVRSRNERYDLMRDELEAEILDGKERRARAKARKKQEKAESNAKKQAGKRVFVLAFKGDVMATAVAQLSREIDAVLIAARPELDEVVLRLQSPGGTVTGYGLASAEISRLRARKIKVTASVDQVAASGGYMMACAADRIVAAPFALIGSIGVVASAPNLHRLLKKNDIDYEELTAGEFKRTLSILGEITPAGREHALEKIEDIHAAFKTLVAERRPGADIARIANGDVWLAREALGLGLVDALATGDDLLFQLKDEARLYEISAVSRKSPLQQILKRFGLGDASAPAGLAALGRVFAGR
jgi:serine protease SohB